jgi:hypothetical protein
MKYTQNTMKNTQNTLKKHSKYHKNTMGVQVPRDSALFRRAAPVRPDLRLAVPAAVPLPQPRGDAPHVPDDQRGRPQGVDGVRAWRFEGVLRLFLIGNMVILMGKRVFLG